MYRSTCVRLSVKSVQIIRHKVSLRHYIYFSSWYNFSNVLNVIVVWWHCFNSIVSIKKIRSNKSLQEVWDNITKVKILTVFQIFGHGWCSSHPHVEKCFWNLWSWIFTCLLKMLMLNVKYILLCEFMSIIDTDGWTKIGHIYMIKVHGYYLLYYIIII